MKRPFDPGVRHPGVEALLGEIPAALLDERAWFATELTERYATELALDAVAALGLAPELARGGSASVLLERRGFVADFLPALSSLLARLAGDAALGDHARLQPGRGGGRTTAEQQQGAGGEQA